MAFGLPADVFVANCVGSEWWVWFTAFVCVCVCVPDLEKDDGEPGNGIAQWRLNEQLFPCPVCGKVFGRQQTLSRHLSLHTGK